MYDAALIISSIKFHWTIETWSLWRKVCSLSTCASSYRVVGCLFVRIQAIETVDSKHISHAASVCQHILLLSKTHRIYVSRYYIIMFVRNKIDMWEKAVSQSLKTFSTINVTMEEPAKTMQQLHTSLFLLTHFTKLYYLIVNELHITSRKTKCHYWSTHT